MAGKIKKDSGERTFDKVIDELFFGKDAALEKFAKVRHTQYEINIWRKKGLPLEYCSPAAKKYFNQRFLPEGVTIKNASSEQLKRAFASLDYAVGKGFEKPTGCYQRCTKLTDELIACIIKEGLDNGRTFTVDGFLDYFTFDAGPSYPEKPYNVELISCFYDEENRKEFKAAIKFMRELDRKMSFSKYFSLIKNVKNNSEKK